MTQDADDSVILLDAVTPANDGSSGRRDRVPALCGITRNIALNCRQPYNGPVDPADAAEHRWRPEGESSVIQWLRAPKKVRGAAKPRPALSDDETKRRRLAAHVVRATQRTA